jgi:hypothetical protein
LPEIKIEGKNKFFENIEEKARRVPWKRNQMKNEP